MAQAISPVPEGYPGVTPYLITQNAAQAIDFYKKAFNATEVMRMATPEGTIMHAEIRIGDMPVMLADEHPHMGFISPKTLGGSAVSLHLYVVNVDQLFNQAVAAGATVKKPLKDEFFGDRLGSVVDPFRHIWSLASRKEIISLEEMDKRFKQMLETGNPE